MSNHSAKKSSLAFVAVLTKLDNDEFRPLPIKRGRGILCMLSAVFALMMLLLPVAIAQQAPETHTGTVTIQGAVLSSDGTPVSGAVVNLEKKGSPDIVESKTSPSGAFSFSFLSTGNYQLSAKKLGLHSPITTVVASSEKDTEKVDLVIQTTTPNSGVSSPAASQTMKFADQPNFTVAGVTDWTAVGGHGSDSTLRTSESLASETVALKPENTGHGNASAPGIISEGKGAESRLHAALTNAPHSFDANYQLGKFYLSAGRYPEAIQLLEEASRISPANDESQYDLVLAYEGAGNLSQAREHTNKLLAHQQSADAHRLLGELDEKSGDPLSAVREYEQAVKLSPSEQNYFEWGSELLLHRAVWQAEEVFRKGVDAYPKSARMQTGLGTALFAGARYDEAALHLCTASDLNPTDPTPYLFMGKIQVAAPNYLACVEPKLARFVQQQPENSVAIYFYAMSILKQQEQSPDKSTVQQAESLLTKAVTIDSKCSEAYLQLGIISVSRRNFDQAIGFYKKAIEANPQFADAYYRLGVAYDRIGQPSKAKQEFQLHDQLKQQQAEAIEQQRREVKQFLIVQSGRATAPATK